MDVIYELYCVRLWMIIGLILLIPSFIVSYIVKDKSDYNDFVVSIKCLSCMLIVIGCFCFAIPFMVFVIEYRCNFNLLNDGANRYIEIRNENYTNKLSEAYKIINKE